jgi:hypothetical protein
MGLLGQVDSAGSQIPHGVIFILFLSADYADWRRFFWGAFLSADYADSRRLWRCVLPLRVKPRRRFFVSRLRQILADWCVFHAPARRWASLSADYADSRRLWRCVLPLRVKPRRRFFIRRLRRLAQIFFFGGGIRRLRRLAQIFGGLSCRCASSHAAGFCKLYGNSCISDLVNDIHHSFGPNKSHPESLGLYFPAKTDFPEVGALSPFGSSTVMS